MNVIYQGENIMGTKTAKAAILTRVSTDHQSVQMQVDECTAWCESKKIPIFKIYEEKISGAKKNSQRKILQQMIADAQAGKFSHLIIYRLDRLGRSVTDVLEVIDILCTNQNVSLVSLHEALDTSTPLGIFTVTILSALNSLSRQMTVARVKSGIQAYRKKNGGAWGRKKKVWDTQLAQKLYAQNYSLRSISRQCGASLGVVWAFFQEHGGVQITSPQKAS